MSCAFKYSISNIVTALNSWYVLIYQERNAYKWPVTAPPLFFFCNLIKAELCSVVICNMARVMMDTFEPASPPSVKLPFILFAFKLFFELMQYYLIFNNFFNICSLKAEINWQMHILFILIKCCLIYGFMRFPNLNYLHIILNESLLHTHTYKPRIFQNKILRLVILALQQLSWPIGGTSGILSQA